MECTACGATLREGARFCNKCGATLGEDLPESSSNPPSVTPEGAPSPGSDANSTGRVRRPARVPRAVDDAPLAPSSRSMTVPVAIDILATSGEEQTQPPQDEIELAPGASDGSSELAEPEMPDLDAVEGDAENAASDASQPVRQSAGAASTPDTLPSQSAETDSASGEPMGAVPASSALSISSASSSSESPHSMPSAATSAPDAASGPPSNPETAAAWEDADTVEYNIILQRGQSLDAIPVTPSPADMPALGELARSPGAHGVPGDALPWPLPVSIIVGGRYRVEEAISTGPDSADTENVYRVHDLQGYERCWSCGAEHGADAATDRFCPQCGADMLSRDFLLSERRHEDNSPTTASDTETAQAQILHTFVQAAREYRVIAHAEEPTLFPRGVRVAAAMATDTGISRTGEENEDSAGVFALSLAHDSRAEPLSLCVVADGLGGHASGQEASRLAVRILGEHILRTLALPHLSARPGATEDTQSFQTGLIAALKDGVEAANKAICARNKTIGADMGSTCVAVLISRDTAYFVNVGDSRGYVLEEGGLRRVTSDHSLVEQLVASGLITPEERYTHPQRNQIFRSLGDEPNVALDTFTQQLRPGMRLLLCSDGLWEMVRDDEMARILRETTSPQQACDLLISAANDHGGEDNISAVVVDIYA